MAIAPTASLTPNIMHAREFQRFMRQQRAEGDAKLKELAGNSAMPSHIAIEDAAAYWTFLTVGQNLDVRL